MRRLLPCLLLAWPLLAPAPAVHAADPFQLEDGDRVVLIGNTLIEQEQRDGYWETLLTSRYPRRQLVFRNLGWSGDTVFGDARAEFGSAADGFRHLKDEVLAAKPTVILVGYGQNESFAGPAGLPHFLDGLNTLLDTLAETKARLVLLSPLRQEDLGAPLPDPAPQNRNVRLYADALRQVADKRGCPFVDLYDLLGDGARAKPPAPLTTDGLHLSPYGYWRSGLAVERGLSLAPARWSVEVDGSKVGQTQGTRVEKVQAAPLRFQVTDDRLPIPPAPADSPRVLADAATKRLLRVGGLAPGDYTLRIDGKPVATASASAWAAGVALARGPEFTQVEELRRHVIVKNQFYFHRWRPQNDTYLFGFRKHEQGQNAREIPLFDPLVRDEEAAIAKLRTPLPHQYELLPQAEKDR